MALTPVHKFILSRKFIGALICVGAGYVPAIALEWVQSLYVVPFSFIMAGIGAGIVAGFKGLLQRPRGIDGSAENPVITQSWALFLIGTICHLIIGIFL